MELIISQQTFQINIYVVNNDKRKTTANTVFIKLWRDVKHSTLNHYFTFVVN